MLLILASHISVKPQNHGDYVWIIVVLMDYCGLDGLLWC